MTLKNAGTRALTGVQLKTQNPVDWKVAIEPSLVDELAVGQESTVKVSFHPPPGVSLGDYNIRLASEARSGNKTINGDEKIVRVSLVEPVDIWQSAFLITLMLGLLAGVVVAGVKITRR